MDSEKEQPHLNLDTLRLICNSLTDVSDVLSFALTCSALKNDAFQRRLRMSPIVLSNTKAIDRFYDFIFADAAGRTPHVYGLKIHNPPYTAERIEFLVHNLLLSDLNSDTQTNNSPPQTTNDRLVAILEGAMKLEYLSLSTAGLEGPVQAAIANISTLRELVLYGRYDRGPFFKLLTTLRAPLRYLHIEEYITGSITAGFFHTSLSHFAPTLEILEMTDFALDTSPSSVTTQFTAMRSLKVELVYCFEDLGLLLRLFPNLRDTLAIKTLSTTGNESDFPAIRERSKEAQKTHTWPGLDHVVCSPKCAFLLALQCPVRRMDLEGQISFPPERQHLIEVLRHNSPRQLSFCMDVFGDLCNPAGLFPTEAAERLTHLVFCLSIRIECRQAYDADNINRPWSRFLDTLVDSMKHLRLTHLRVVLQYQVLRDRDVLPGSVDEAAVYFASEQDLRPAATRFFETISTLRVALLTTCGYTTVVDGTQSRRNTSKWQSSNAWHTPDIRDDVRPSDMGRGLYSEMNNEEAEAVINREELHLGSREQAMVDFCSGALS